MATHGSGTLSSLILRRESWEDEEAGGYTRRDERRLSLVLNGPQMRSMRLIGNSNPWYRWERYWKTEEKLKTMRKPMLVIPASNSPRTSGC